MERETVGRIVAAVLFVAGLGAVALLDARSGDAGPPARVDFRLREVAEEAGVTFEHRPPRLDEKLSHIAPYVASVGASVSVADANGDGPVDLYFTSSRTGTDNALYLNRRDGSFVSAGPEAGVASLNRQGDGVSMGSVWGDYDNDGDEDLLVYRWGRPALLENRGARPGGGGEGPDGRTGPAVPRFREVTRAAGLDVRMNANCAVWFDYDGDGRLDLYLCGYYRADANLLDLGSTRIMPESWEYASNGGRNRLFRNEGGGTFREVTEEAGAGDTHWSEGVGSSRWTLAAAAADFDGNGWPDLYLANDYGPEELLLNRGGEGFELASVGLGESGSGMSVALGDVRNRGRLDVYVTNISERGYLFQGNNLRLNTLRGPSSTFRNVAEGPVADAGWAWGAQFGDLDLDGRVDLFVANGMVSADPDRSYWYDLAKITGAHRWVFRDASNWPPMGRSSLSGYQRSRVLLNLGERGMAEVGARVGVTDRLDGRGVALADLDDDGDQDVVVANQGGRALIYRNEAPPWRHWIGFRLEGTVSNRSAIGTELTLHFGDVEQRQLVTGGAGFAAQNDRRLFFGLGSATRVERAVIEWPSGRRQVLDAPAVDSLHVVREPRP